jgi:L-amino acid N-acyltransferase YncA
MEYCIRLAQTKDQESLLLLIKEHASFEGHELVLTKQHQQLHNVDTLPVTIFVVESNNKLFGYMSVIKQFSTWDMDCYLYPDCLYLAEETRGQGMGLKLMNTLKLFSQKTG